MFCGTFTAGKLLECQWCEDGKLRIVTEGESKKFVNEVEHRTFSGKYASRRGQTVLYITERCVFRLVEGGMELVEVAPGIDIQKDIVAQMEFAPIIKSPVTMDARLFGPDTMGLRSALLEFPLEQRFIYDPQQNLFFVNLEGYRVVSLEQVKRIGQVARARLEGVPGKVYAIVNYDNFSISPELVDPYADMVKRLMDEKYAGVTRYTTSVFLRMKLGDALSSSGVTPEIYDNAGEAREHLREIAQETATAEVASVVAGKS